MNERRAFDLELRVDKQARKITGHAAVFDVEGDGVWFREKIAPGAFADSVQTDDVRALWNHDANFVLGRNRAGTLRLHEDERGLAIEIDPPDTQFARDLLVSIERGDVSQMSFGFQTVRDSWERSTEGNGQDLRTLEKVKLFDVSPVTFPFYPETDVAVRSHEKWEQTINDPEPTWNQVANMRRRLKLNSWR
jgi:HK97 family phage prohead protease